MDETVSFPNAGTAIKDAIKEAAKNPRINFGSLYQISDTPIFLLLSPLFSTFVAKNTATANAINPIRIFWMDFTRTAALASSARMIPGIESRLLILSLFDEANAYFFVITHLAKPSAQA